MSLILVAMVVAAILKLNGNIVFTGVIPMTVAMSNSDTLVIGVSLSGRTREILDALRAAAERKAATVLITANRDTGMEEICTDVLYVAADRDLDGGTAISPQFPVLILMDVLYTY